MEDVKKLAKKFVSESLAEQIADFIAKVSSNAVGNVANVSEENEKNFNSDGGLKSDEDDFRNNKIARQRTPNKIEPKLESTTAKTTKYLPITTEKTKWPNSQNKKYKPTKTKQGIVKRPEKWLKKHRLPKNQPDLNNDNKHVKSVSEKIEEYHQEMSADVEPLQDLQVTVKNTKEHRKPRKKHENETPQSFNSNIESTLGYAEKYGVDESLDLNRFRLARVDSEEINDTNLKKVFESTNAKYAGFNIDTGGQDLTTEKEKNEFDQYDNKQYPKPEFVATSGPVALPKMPPQSEFWDKDISEVEKSKEHSRKRKAWF